MISKRANSTFLSTRALYLGAALSLSAILAGCSSSPSTKTPTSAPRTQPTQAPVQAPVSAQAGSLGAITQGRSFISASSPTVARATVDSALTLVNAADFQQQIRNIQSHNSRIASNYGNTYARVNQWIAAGANVADLARYGFNISQMRGEDGYQNVLMTGYFSPVIKAKRTPQGEYRHPIYRMPSGYKAYTRAQIYAGALAGKGLELAYTRSMMDNFSLGVQGSGYMDFGEGRLEYLAYGGQNGHKYVPVGAILVREGEVPKSQISMKTIREWGERNPARVQGLLERNPSFVYFTHDPNGQVKGSAAVPLVGGASVASDRSVVPSGSVLLVEEPVLDYYGRWTGRHELRLMVALDIGGAVKGQHLDLYQGIGDNAGYKAGLMKHFGRVWILK